MAKAAGKDPEALSGAERTELAAFLTGLKLWWLTPMTATGEADRLRAVVDSFEAARGIITR